MTKQDLENYIAAYLGVDSSDGQVKVLVEVVRQMVLSADGEYIWNNLKRVTTLPITANNASYTFPPDGSDDPPISALVYVKGQADTDRPIKVYSEEEAAETDFTKEFEGIIVRRHDEPGKITIVFKNTPTTAGTKDVAYRQIPGDDLDFVKTESHDVFLAACDYRMPIKGVDPVQAAQIRQINYNIYKDRLRVAQANDYRATQEAGKTLPVQPIRTMQDVLMSYQGDRD